MKLTSSIHKSFKEHGYPLIVKSRGYISDSNHFKCLKCVDILSIIVNNI